ncbi:succinylglutamate desuccinylase/aspartoacylase domain-containing protein [Haloarchaeobius amylolyticus]|uniref:succinylglutamate desuccinylase/aspartoacylase domain-containing protein n=1 Tax=Haloarchaeobius amylolyticus TaxID=1198296 RepID=UPI00226E0754|nr:succinylglutamate desuccinylase/aspartoacylase family protein [Haloarchaeobius amylolyticus]
MRVVSLGTGDPEVAVVVCIHGDELCGKRALDRFLDADPTVEAPVKFVVANERALDAGSRFVDEDLNRAFPGDPDADTHEGRLAAELLEELAGLRVLDLHSTHSSPEPFALYQRATPGTFHVLARAGVDRAVDISHVPGGLVGYCDGAAVECGLKGSEAAVDAAERILRGFLAGNGVIDAPASLRDPEVFAVTERVEGAGYEFLGENFAAVPPGQPFARRGDEELTRPDCFYPVLMSTDGYDDIVGFAARRVGRLSDLDPDSGR